MLDFLIVYISIAVAWFITAVIVSTKDCKKLNAGLSREVYSVNYVGCFIKSLFFPLIIVKIICGLITVLK